MFFIIFTHSLYLLPQTYDIGASGSAEVKDHPFFNGIDWTQIALKQHHTPFRPKIVSAGDTSNFNEDFTKMEAIDIPCNPPVNHKHLFKGIRLFSLNLSLVRFFERSGH